MDGGGEAAADAPSAVNESGSERYVGIGLGFLPLRDVYCDAVGDPRRAGRCPIIYRLRPRAGALDREGT